MPSTVWRGRIAFGMVAIPVRLYKAARRERIRFHHVYAPEPEPEYEPEPLSKKGRGIVHEFPAPARPSPEYEQVSRVRESVGSGDGDARPVPRSEILKGFEASKDQYVVFKPSEIAALRPPTSSELEIVEFVKLAEIDPIFFDASYYVAPEKGGERPFALFVSALQRTGDVAVGTLAMHGREHAVVIRPGKQGLILHTLFYANEVRADEEWSGDAAPVNEKELELAMLLVQSMAEPFEPAKLKDTFEERLRELVEARAPTPARGAAASAPPPAIDILEALKRSLAARKPIQPERRTRPSAKKARTKP
jgi:DNA end-binding protein Ku